MSNGSNLPAATGDRWLQPVATKGTLQNILLDSKDAIKQILPKHITPGRVLKMALIAASRDPKIYECTARSVVDAIMRASEFGLDFSGTFGEGYIIPYKRQATFIPGWRGYIRLARNSGQISTFEAHVVYEDDKFELEYGLNPRLVHMPNLKPVDPKKRIVFGAYAVVLFKDGSHQHEFMNLTQLEGIRKRSKNTREDSPWNTDTEEMYRKTVVRRIAKYLPLSPEMEKLRAYDNEVDTLDPTFAAALVDNLGSPDQPATGSTSDQITDELMSRQNGDPNDHQSVKTDESGAAEAKRELTKKEQLTAKLLEMSGDKKYNTVPGLKASFKQLEAKIGEMSEKEMENALANIEDVRLKHEKAAKKKAKDGDQGKLM